MCCGNAGMASLRPRSIHDQAEGPMKPYEPGPAEQAHQAIARLDAENHRLRSELTQTQIALAKYVTASHGQ